MGAENVKLPVLSQPLHLNKNLETVLNNDYKSHLVFRLLKRNGKVYTIVVPNAQSAILLPIIRKKVKPDSIVYTDTFRSYDVLDISEFSQFRH